MADRSQSACLNHPESPAAARCATCGKPVCQICLVQRNGACYCSNQCADNAEKSFGRVNTVIESKQRADGKAFKRGIIFLIILAILAAAGYFYYVNNKAEVQRTLKKTERQLKRTEGKLSRHAKSVKSDIQENLPGDSKYKKEREQLVK